MEDRSEQLLRSAEAASTDKRTIYNDIDYCPRASGGLKEPMFFEMASPDQQGRVRLEVVLSQARTMRGPFRVPQEAGFSVCAVAVVCRENCGIYVEQEPELRVSIRLRDGTVVDLERRQGANVNSPRRFSSVQFFVIGNGVAVPQPDAGPVSAATIARDRATYDAWVPSLQHSEHIFPFLSPAALQQVDFISVSGVPEDMTEDVRLMTYKVRVADPTVFGNSITGGALLRNYLPGDAIPSTAVTSLPEIESMAASTLSTSSGTPILAESSVPLHSYDGQQGLPRASAGPVLVEQRMAGLLNRPGPQPTCARGLEILRDAGDPETHPLANRTQQAPVLVPDIALRPVGSGNTADAIALRARHPSRIAGGSGSGSGSGSAGGAAEDGDQQESQQQQARREAQPSRLSLEIAGIADRVAAVPSSELLEISRQAAMLQAAVAERMANEFSRARSS